MDVAHVKYLVCNIFSTNRVIHAQVNLSCFSHLLFPRLFPAGGRWSWNLGWALNAEVPVPKPVPPSPAPPEPKAPPVAVPRAGVPNPPVRLVVPNLVVVPRPVAPRVLVPRGVPNAAPAVRPVTPSPVVVPNGFPRDAVPAVPREPVKPIGFVWSLPRTNDWGAKSREQDVAKLSLMKPHT